MPPIFTCSQFVHLLSFPIVFSLYTIYLPMCVHRAITGYFSLAFTKLNKLDLSECTVTDRYKCTYSPSAHTCSELDESLILRSPRCVKKQRILLSTSIVLVQPCCLGTSAGLHPDNMDLRSAFICVIFLLVVFRPVTVSIHLPLNMGEKNYMPYSP